MISPVGNARTLSPLPDDTWGVRLVDLNLPLGDPTTIVGAESRAWRAAHSTLRAR